MSAWQWLGWSSGSSAVALLSVTLLRRYTTAVREEIKRLLDAAVEAGELEATHTSRLAQGVQTAYNGALITWAIYRKGRLDAWLRRELDTLLAPYRSR